MTSLVVGIRQWENMSTNPMTAVRDNWCEQALYVAVNT